MKLSIDSALMAVARTAACDAGALALDMQKTLGPIHRKSARDLVTEADYACEKLILGQLKQAFPEHHYVAEESGASGSGEEVGYTWYIDPIDGTINYARGIPLWGISIACCRNGQPVAGVIYLPALNELYTATADSAACCNDVPIAVSDIDDPELAIILNSDFNTVIEPSARERLNDASLDARRRQAATLQRVRTIGSAVVESAWVAAGRVEGYLMLKVNPWDIAAGMLLVSRAGGRTSGADGRAWNPSVPHALLSNGRLHEHFLSQVRLA